MHSVPTVRAPRTACTTVARAKFRPQSRIGKKPVQVPADVSVSLNGNLLSVKGPKGELSREFHPLVTLKHEENKLMVSRNADTKPASALHGLSRALCNNMVMGVHQGFERKLVLKGVGYRASVAGQTLTMNVGYSHPVVMDIPKDITVAVQDQVTVVCQSRDLELLGNFAATVRAKRPPEPYKGKGIRYIDEKITLKAGKSGGK